MRFLFAVSPGEGDAVVGDSDFVTKFDNGTRKYDVAVQRAGGSSTRG